MLLLITTTTTTILLYYYYYLLPLHLSPSLSPYCRRQPAASTFLFLLSFSIYLLLLATTTITYYFNYYYLLLLQLLVPNTTNFYYNSYYSYYYYYTTLLLLLLDWSKKSRRLKVQGEVATSSLQTNKVSSQTYSLDANLCLLRLYQFEPERMKIQTVACILIKALMAMPAPDFSLCLFLIPEQVQLEEQLKTLIVLSHYLETARFHQFWDEAAKNRSILDVVPGFDKAIQNYAVHVLSLTYQKVSWPVLAEAINIEGPALDKFVEYQVANAAWAIEKGSSRTPVIVLPRNEFNHPELKKNKADSIPLEHVTRVFPILG